MVIPDLLFESVWILRFEEWLLKVRLNYWLLAKVDVVSLWFVYFGSFRVSQMLDFDCRVKLFLEFCLVYLMAVVLWYLLQPF